MAFTRIRGKEMIRLRDLKKIVFLMISVAIASGCAHTNKTVSLSKDENERYSPHYPTRNLTGFTQGLRCMDAMFVARDVDPLYITAAPIPDYTENRGAAGYGARDMLISALSEMTKRSAAIRYVAFDRSTPDIVAMQNSHPKKKDLRVPDFFIRGAVTQINTSPFSKQRGGSLSVGQVATDVSGAGATSSGSLSLATVSLDLTVGLISTYQLLPGVFSANVFSVDKTGSSDELSLSMTKVGGVYRASKNEAKALSEGLRALIEVGAIELFGKLYGLPYWECLAVIGEHRPEVQTAYEFYDKWNDKRVDSYVFDYLVEENYLSTSASMYIGRNRALSLPFRSAILQLRSELNVFGGPSIDRELFSEIWINKNRRASSPLNRGQEEPLSPAVVLPPIERLTASGGGNSTTSSIDTSLTAPVPGAPPVRAAPPPPNTRRDIQPNSGQ